MLKSPAEETATRLGALRADLRELHVAQTGVEPTRANPEAVIGLPASMVADLVTVALAAGRQLDTLAVLTRSQSDRVQSLESTNGAQSLKLSQLRGTESARVEALSRWAVGFAVENGVEPSKWPALVDAQLRHDETLWARLDRERMALEQYRLAVHAITEQIRDAKGATDGLDGHGVKVVLRALDQAYRRSRL